MLFRSAQFLNNSHSPQSPPLADTPRGRVTAGVPDRPTFWDDADDVIHLNTDGSPDTECVEVRIMYSFVECMLACVCVGVCVGG